MLTRFGSNQPTPRLWVLYQPVGFQRLLLIRLEYKEDLTISSHQVLPLEEPYYKSL